MSRLAHLYPEYADQNDWLLCLLGIVSGTTQLAGSLPRPRGGRRGPPEIDPFVAALLGALSLRAEIGTAAHQATPRRAPAATAPTRSPAGGRRSSRLPRRPGEFMR